MRDPFPAWSGKNSGHSRPISRGCVLHRKCETNTRVVPPNQESPIVSVHSRGPVFPVLPLLSRRGSSPTTVARWTALYEILVRKPRGKSSRESHRSHDRRDGKRHTAATAREESASACPLERRADFPGETPELPQYPFQHWRRILRFRPRLHTTP